MNGLAAHDGIGQRVERLGTQLTGDVVLQQFRLGLQVDRHAAKKR